MNGIFLSLEGGEGSGKTSVNRNIQKYLDAKNVPYILTREPGGTPTGEKIRDLLQHEASGESICSEAEALLFHASRAQLIDRVIKPSLQKGLWVISDRFEDSSLVYQGAGRGLKGIRDLANFTVKNTWPDITFFLDCPPEIGFKRLNHMCRSEDYKMDTIEKESLEFHSTVYEAYKKLAIEEKHRIRSIDATQEPDMVWNDVRAYLEPIVTEYNISRK